MPPLTLSAVAFTHEGAVRPANEDTVALGEWVRADPMDAPEAFTLDVAGPVLALVADGMGGHAAGEVASREAAEYLARQAARAVDEEAVAALVHEAHAELYALMQEQPRLAGMGTTVAGVAFGPQRAVVFNVGDSRVHRIEGGRLTQLTTDDTPGPKLADGRTARFTSNIITQTLGGGARPDEIAPHVLSEPLRDGAAYLIASDGLTDLVEVAEMEALLRDDDRRTVQLLFEAAMQRGGRDNVSIVIARTSLGGNGC